MICEQCGRCCRYIILPCNPGGKLDKDLSDLRGLVLYGDYLIVPCQCIELVRKEFTGYLCALHNTGDQPQACTDQKAGGFECLLLHEVFP
jgi:hypothetical protein